MKQLNARLRRTQYHVIACIPAITALLACGGASSSDSSGQSRSSVAESAGAGTQTEGTETSGNGSAQGSDSNGDVSGEQGTSGESVATSSDGMSAGNAADTSQVDNATEGPSMGNVAGGQDNPGSGNVVMPLPGDETAGDQASGGQVDGDSASAGDQTPSDGGVVDAGPAGETAPVGSADAAAGQEQKTLSNAECVAAGGVVVGDPGNGSTHRSDYLCEQTGEPPIAIIMPAEGEPIPIEGAVCCGTKSTGSGNDSCKEIQCIRAVECVTSCGGEVISSGCCPCPPGSFDSIECQQK